MSSKIQKLVALCSAFIINGVFCATSFANNSYPVSASTPASPVPATKSSIQTVVIAAKRLNAKQKADYDTTQNNSSMQTVTISAKRLSAADKSAFDKSAFDKSPFNKAHEKQQTSTKESLS